MDIFVPGIPSALLILLLLSPGALGQVCSTIGGLCKTTKDCCKGCCESEAHVCVERPYPCTPDLVPIPGQNSCEKYFCAPDEFCFLAELEILYSGGRRKTCTPDNPCPPQPFCRKIPSPGNNGTYFMRRNSTEHIRPMVILIVFMCLAFCNMFID